MSLTASQQRPPRPPEAHCRLPHRNRAPRQAVGGAGRLIRDGFTLLELLLALVLAAMIAVAVSMAVDLYLRAFDSGRTGVEEARLARALLRRISDDLRSGIRYDPLDIESMLPDIPLTGELDSLLGDESDSETSTSSQLSSAGDQRSYESQSIPGLYGGPDWLQVDVSRLPRIDQFDQYLSPGAAEGPIERPSDVKTVVYWVIDVSGSGSAPAGMPAGITWSMAEGTTRTGGLMRLEMGRATAQFAASQGGLADLQPTLEPIAPEVLAIGFRYYDGAEWFDSWDSTEKGGLPVAVHVELAIARSPSNGNPRQVPGAGGVDLRLQEAIIYRVLVHVPAARPTYEGAEEAPAEESQSLTGVSATGGTSGGGTGGGGTGGGGTGGGGGQPKEGGR